MCPLTLPAQPTAQRRKHILRLNQVQNTILNEIHERILPHYIAEINGKGTLRQNSAVI
jgi:hypothetical protein